MFKVTKFIYENNLQKKIRIRKYITVKSGLSWQEAKTMRDQDHELQIVYEHIWCNVERIKNMRRDRKRFQQINLFISIILIVYFIWISIMLYRSL